MSPDMISNHLLRKPPTPQQYNLPKRVRAYNTQNLLSVWRRGSFIKGKGLIPIYDPSLQLHFNFSVVLHYYEKFHCRKMGPTCLKR